MGTNEARSVAQQGGEEFTLLHGKSDPIDVIREEFVMQFVTESIPGEITLMFISYLVFCTVLMYLFIKTDSEWGKLEVSLDEVPSRPAPAASVAAVRYLQIEPESRSLLDSGLIRPSLQHCAQYHDIDCTCFMKEQGKAD